MSDARPDLIASRGAQMFPELSAEEMDRLAPFGTPISFRAGEMVARVGEIGQGLVLILAGEIEVTRRDGAGHGTHVVTHRRGSFLGELAQLSGRPFLVDAAALSDVEAVAIAPDRLRALLVAEAELGERIMRALILRRVGLIEAGAGPVIIGADSDGDVLRLVNFLRRNGHPHQRLGLDDLCARTLVERFHLASEDLPIVLCPGGQILRNPSEDRLARCIGLLRTIDGALVYDVVIVGAGPAGLAASVYAASEGLSVLALDCRSFGGQAGASARIENYLGFPTGISGMALMGRAFNQAQKFGVEMAIPDEVVALEGEGGDLRLRLATGEQIRTRTVVIATGARYRRLDIGRLDEFEGTSVHYWASPLEADLAAGRDVAVAGGGNSAGQATVFLASRARRVTLVARRPLAATMSSYLIERIEALANVELVIGCEVAALAGPPGELEALTLIDRSSGDAQSRSARYLFSFIGAEPNTDWLTDALQVDPHGFLVTGADAGTDRLPLETSRRGVFAVGDVRSASVKRVAAAVGDGALVVASIHQHLRTLAEESNVTLAAPVQAVPA